MIIIETHIDYCTSDNLKSVPIQAMDAQGVESLEASIALTM